LHILSQAGGKWIFRFNRKFPIDLSDLWVDLVRTTPPLFLIILIIKFRITNNIILNITIVIIIILIQYHHHHLPRFYHQVLAAVTEGLPRAELVAGCIFTTRKGKSEMEIWTVDDPMAELPGQKVAPPSEKKQQIAIRKLLGVSDKEKTISVVYKSHQHERQKKDDYDRVMKVREILQPREIL
jgi:hypothetical protein